MQNLLSRLSFGIFVLLAMTPSSYATTDPTAVESGPIRQWLSALDFGEKNAGHWVEPSAQQWQQFSLLFDDFFRLRIDAVEQKAGELGLRFTRFGPDGQANESEYLVLGEKARPGETNFIGFGTYVIKSKGVELVIGAPHPKTDLNTGTQAIDAFLNTRARYLFLPGTRRDSRTDHSPCTGGSYRISDASHYHRHVFYLAHERLNQINPNAVFMQWHGFGSKALKRLQSQCESKKNTLVIISEGVPRTASSPDSLANLLHQTVNANTTVRSCLFGVDTTMLGATRTTVGRLANGQDNACNQDATSTTGRFVHVEQSYEVRRHHRDVMIDALNTAINDWFAQ